jgi:TetR/AcrR family transcriptional repressor of nem operon
MVTHGEGRRDPWKTIEPEPRGIGYAATREVLIRRGMEVLTEQRFAATGLAALLRPATVPKGSFCHYFGSKADFGRAYYSFFCHKLDRALNDEALAASERMRIFVEDAKARMAKHGYARLRGQEPRSGGQGVAGRPPRCAEQDRAGLAKAARCLVLAREADEIDVSADSDALAEFSGSVGKERSCGPAS